ncbi:MAG TPA: DUF2946 family protein [Longimicrobium sp.]|jgi:hypothetical protein|uniref:DUF2946 family protein n=1 Tax=Longimicrobium sp. TaxID=2029185 RepID=UPI002EDA9829
MKHAFRPATPLRRFLALLGVCLHLLGAVALREVHTWGLASAVERAAQDSGPRDDKQQRVPPHDEQHCVLCHAAGNAALAADGPEIPVCEAAGPAEFRAPARPAAPRLARDARARAPPALS